MSKVHYRNLCVNYYYYVNYNLPSTLASTKTCLKHTLCCKVRADCLNKFTNRGKKMPHFHHNRVDGNATTLQTQTTVNNLLLHEDCDDNYYKFSTTILVCSTFIYKNRNYFNREGKTYSVAHPHKNWIGRCFSLSVCVYVFIRKWVICSRNREKCIPNISSHQCRRTSRER